jgi:hypothetical protein
MASPGIAPATERRKQQRLSPLLTVLITVIVQVIGIAYGYGRISEHVEAIQRQVDEIKADLRALRGGK